MICCSNREEKGRQRCLHCPDLRGQRGDNPAAEKGPTTAGERRETEERRGCEGTERERTGEEVFRSEKRIAMEGMMSLRFYLYFAPLSSSLPIR